MSNPSSVDSAKSRTLFGALDATYDFQAGECDGNAAMQPKYLQLIEVEKYFLEKVQSLDVATAYDITASESVDFKTLNYTTYAGMFIIHPLSFEISMRQMLEAAGDNNAKGHVNFIKKLIETDRGFSKYDFTNPVDEQNYRDVLVVLTGGNKLKKHCCAGKMQQIIEIHGRDNVTFKKHPISYDEVYDELSDFLGGINYADAHSDLYDLMENATYVYTTMKSESALIANILGKKVDHFDLFNNRPLGSFSHINNFIFSNDDPLSWVDKAFGSYKSGVIHPVVDEDWRVKIDMYLDYILKLRNYFSNSYVWS